MFDQKIINSIKGLSIDMITSAKSGHPGVALGMAPAIYTLYSKHMNINLNDDKWFNRDRFVLSGGHASALLYSMLYYVGFLNLDDLKKFRKINYTTPGHPEITTPGVDISTGPLGEGVGNAVGMAIAQKYYETTLDKHIDYYTYVMVGDGDLMEGGSYEALSLAGTLNLNKLIILYDSNKISLDGRTNITFNDNIRERFESIGFNYLKVSDGNNIEEIDNVISIAKISKSPTIIEINTIIGDGSLKEGTNLVHGSPLSSEDVTQLKEKLNLSLDMFNVNISLVDEFRNNLYKRCNLKVEEFSKYWPNIEERLVNDKIDLLSLVKPFYENIDESLRETNGKIMNVIGDNMYTFIGGCADVSSSTKSFLLGKGVFSKEDYAGKNIFYGVREHAMGSITNGVASSRLRPFASTFLVFSDYMKPSIRMASIMKLPVIYVFTHDSITIGSDGVTHQPIEHLSMLRDIPNLNVYRPADANEILGCWNSILNTKLPSVIILSRNSSPLINGSNSLSVEKGAYIIKEPKKRMDAIIIATGTEVELAIKISKELEHENIFIRVVSMPSMELYEKTDKKYKNEILPMGYKTFVIEYGTSSSWYKYVHNEKYLININTFGKSGSKNEILEYFKLDYESVLNRIKNLIK